MNPNGFKLGAAATVAIVLVLLFSWQYLGQDEEAQSPMVGEWDTAAVISINLTHGSPVVTSSGQGQQAEMTITQDGDYLTLSSYASQQRFLLISDCEAVSLDHPVDCRLFYSDGSIFYTVYSAAATDNIGVLTLTVTVMTSDGLVDLDQDRPDIINREFAAECGIYDDQGKVASSKIGMVVKDQNFRAVEFDVTIDDQVRHGIGFFRDCEGKQIIDGCTDDGTLITFTADGDDIIVTGVQNDGRFIIGDADGCLSEDILGIADKSVIYLSLGKFPTDVMIEYRGGLMFVSPPEPGENIAVYIPTLHGDGYFLSSSGAPIVLVDGNLTMLADGIII